MSHVQDTSLGLCMGVAEGSALVDELFEDIAFPIIPFGLLGPWISSHSHLPCVWGAAVMKPERLWGCFHPGEAAAGCGRGNSDFGVGLGG